MCRGRSKAGKPLAAEKANAFPLKDCVHLFVIYTALQILFATLYYLIAGTVNATLCIGTCLYAVAMLATWLSYRDARYQKQKQELLNTLP